MSCESPVSDVVNVLVNEEIGCGTKSPSHLVSSATLLPSLRLRREFGALVSHIRGHDNREVSIAGDVNININVIYTSIAHLR